MTEIPETLARHIITNQSERSPWAAPLTSKWKWKLLCWVWLFSQTVDYIVHGIPQARILEWVAYPFSSGSSAPRNWTGVSCIAGGSISSWATREALSPQRLPFKTLQWKSSESFGLLNTSCPFSWHPTNKCCTFLQQNPVSVDWFCCIRVSKLMFSLVRIIMKTDK